jgi:hypothetical protein
MNKRDGRCVMIDGLWFRKNRKWQLKSFRLAPARSLVAEELSGFE